MELLTTVNINGVTLDVTAYYQP